MVLLQGQKNKKAGQYFYLFSHCC